MERNTHTTPNVTGDVPTVPTPDVQPTGDQPARTAADKLRLVQAYETYLPGSPEWGARMRREGISTSQISTWRNQRDQGALPDGSAATQPQTDAAQSAGRRGGPAARVQARRDQAEIVIDVQKNIAHLPGLPTLLENERSCEPPFPTWLR